MDLPIAIEARAIEAFCQKHHIEKLSFFGSVLSDRFTEESDVDVLVEFHPEHIPGLFALAGMEFELTEMLGRKADIRTPADLSHFFRDEVLRSAVVQFAA